MTTKQYSSAQQQGPTKPNVDAFETRRKDPKAMVFYGTFYYTRIGKPITQLNTKDGLIDVDPFYTATLGLSEKSADYMRDKGYNISEPTKDIPKPHIRFKRKVKTPDTSVDFFDIDGKEVDKEILIGNGSYGQALVWSYDFPDGTKGGALMGVQVVDLREYDPEKGSNKPKGGSSYKSSNGNRTSYTKQQETKATPQTRKPMSWSKKQDQVDSSPGDMIDDELPF